MFSGACVVHMYVFSGASGTYVFMLWMYVHLIHVCVCV